MTSTTEKRGFSMIELIFVIIIIGILTAIVVPKLHESNSDTTFQEETAKAVQKHGTAEDQAKITRENW